MSETQSGTPLLQAVSVVRDYPLPRRSLLERAEVLRALHGVSLSLAQGTSLGLIGESGSGKSTLARIVVALDRPDLGTVRLDGEDLFAISRQRLRTLRRRLQMVFQDPFGSLDPRQRVGRIVAEPLVGLLPELSGRDRAERVAGALAAVRLDEGSADRYPHEFSGGQRQRIAIARALVTEPDLIVADEAVSSLDVSVQAQILNLMMDLKERRGVTYLFISHDLTIVRQVCDRVAVLFLGRIVEEGPTEEVFAAPRHPYTAALLAAVPRPDPARRRRPRRTEPEPPLSHRARHCPYAPRCARARDRCRATMPMLEPAGVDRLAACFYPLEG
jgi:peptide/nickel transport system ATP-binding protein